MPEASLSPIDPQTQLASSGDTTTHHANFLSPFRPKRGFSFKKAALWIGGSALLFLIVGVSIFTSQVLLRTSTDNRSSADMGSFTTANDIYVSVTTGNDSNPGTPNQPLKTIQKAQTVVRQKIARGMTGNIQVILSGGIYQVSSPLEFTPQDSGTGSFTVTYISKPGEKAIISSEKRITNWSNEGGNIWSATIPEVSQGKWWFKSLYVNNEVATRARFPNTGYLTATNVSADRKSFSFNPPIPNVNLAQSRGEMVMLQDWDITRVLVASNTTNRMTSNTFIGIDNNSYVQIKNLRRLFFEHAREFIDQPREWYLDQNTGKLFLQLSPGENPNTLAITAPTTTQLLLVKGQSNNKVKNLRFEHLIFQGADWEYPDGNFSGQQANYYGPNSGRPQRLIPAAIVVTHAHNVNFFMNIFRNMNLTGLGIGVGTRSVSVSKNHFYDIGASCIHTGYNPEAILSMDWSAQVRNANDVPELISVQDNYIQRCGLTYWGGSGVVSTFVRRQKIENNEISDLAYSGIQVTGSWEPGETSQRDTNIDRNKVFNVMKELADGGGIYTTGANPGSSVRGNVIYDVRRGLGAQGSHNNGIFFDQATRFITVNNNVIYNTAHDPIRYNTDSSPEYFFMGENFFNQAPGPSHIVSAAGVRAGACSSFTYSNWSACANGQQIRSVTSPEYGSCIGGKPDVVAFCTPSVAENRRSPIPSPRATPMPSAGTCKAAFIEAPSSTTQLQPGQAVTILGWAADPAGIRRVELVINNSAPVQATLQAVDCSNPGTSIYLCNGSNNVRASDRPTRFTYTYTAPSTMAPGTVIRIQAKAYTTAEGSSPSCSPQAQITLSPPPSIVPLTDADCEGTVLGTVRNGEMKVGDCGADSCSPAQRLRVFCLNGQVTSACRDENSSPSVPRCEETYSDKVCTTELGLINPGEFKVATVCSSGGCGTSQRLRVFCGTDGKIYRGCRDEHSSPPVPACP